MANEQRTVRPQCTGVAATAGGGEGGGRAGRGLGLGLGRLGWGRPGTGEGAGPRLGPRAGVWGGGRGEGSGPAGGGQRAGRRAGGPGRAGLRRGHTAGECQGRAASPPPARTYPRPGRSPSCSRHESTWDLGNDRAVGAALRPCHAEGAGGGA